LIFVVHGVVVVVVVHGVVVVVHGVVVGAEVNSHGVCTG